MATRWAWLAESTNGIDGDYTQINPAVLTTDATGTWDGAWVSEPYVLQTPGGWVMVYMGDADPADGFTEQVGIATSTSGFAGPYVKLPANPVLAFGTAGSLDAGTIADPWVHDFNGTYYIGYGASPTKGRWSTSYATTTDWVAFKKSDTVILSQGSSPTVSVFRGAVSLFGGTYYLPYASQDGRPWNLRVSFCMATAPATADWVFPDGLSQ
ncbi:MAG: hypothetical protein ABSC46_01055 [Candidatus Limnocylindrales bacterium]